MKVRVWFRSYSVSMAVPFKDVDWNMYYKECSKRASTAATQLARSISSGSIQRIRTATVNSLFRPESRLQTSSKHDGVLLVRLAHKKKPMAPITELSLLERRRRAEKALEVDRYQETFERKRNLEELSRNPPPVAQPFGPRIQRFFDIGQDYLVFLPSVISMYVVPSFLLVPSQTSSSQQIENELFPGSIPSLEESRHIQQFTKTEFATVTAVIQRLVTHFKPHRDFPSSLVPRSVFSRFLLTTGMVQVSRFNRIGAIVTKMNEETGGTRGANNAVIGVGPNFELLGALCFHKSIDRFDKLSKTLETEPHCQCVSVINAVYLIEKLYFEFERGSEEEAAKDRRKRKISSTDDISGFIGDSESSQGVDSLAPIKPSSSRKGKGTTPARKGKVRILAGVDIDQFNEEEQQRLEGNPTGGVPKNMRDFFFLVMLARVDNYIGERSRVIENRQAALLSRIYAGKPSIKRPSPPEGVSSANYEAGLLEWDLIQESLTDTQKQELSVQAWKSAEYVSSCLVEPEVIYVSRILQPAVRQIVEAYSSSSLMEVLQRDSEEDKREFELIGPNLTFPDFFKFLVDFSLFPEFVNFQQAKELFSSADCVTTFSQNLSKTKSENAKPKDEFASFKEKGWMYKDPSEMNEIERKAFAVLSSIEQWIDDRYLRVKDIFGQFDIDSSGALSPFEFHNAVKRLELFDDINRLTPEEVDHIMLLSDTDSDGQLSLDEFDKAMSKVKEVKQHWRKRQNFLTKPPQLLNALEKKAMSLLGCFLSCGERKEISTSDFLKTFEFESNPAKLPAEAWVVSLVSKREELEIPDDITDNDLIDVTRLFDYRFDGQIYFADMESVLHSYSKVVNAKDPFAKPTTTSSSKQAPVSQELFCTPAMAECLWKIALKTCIFMPNSFDQQACPNFLKIFWLVGLMNKKIQESSTTQTNAEISSIYIKAFDEAREQVFAALGKKSKQKPTSKAKQGVSSSQSVVVLPATTTTTANTAKDSFSILKSHGIFSDANVGSAPISEEENTNSLVPVEISSKKPHCDACNQKSTENGWGFPGCAVCASVDDLFKNGLVGDVFVENLL